MANQRVFLWAGLALILWLLYQAWMHDYHPAAPAAPAAPEATTSSAPASGATPAAPQPQAAKGLGESVPGLPAESSAPGAAAAPPGPAPAVPAATAAPATDIVHVKTDVLDMDIGLKGGELRRADLPKYPRHKDQPNIPVRLLSPGGADPLFLFQSGLTAGKAGAQPDHLAQFASAGREYQLADGQDELKVPLTWTDGQGITVTKTFTFHRGGYGIHIDYAIDNRSAGEWRVASYLQFLREQYVVKRSMWNVESYSFAGPAVYDGTKYLKLKLDNDDDKHYSATVTDGWLAAMQHHFVGAVVPTPGKAYQYKLDVKEHDYQLSAVGPTQVVPAGGRQALSETVFIGPKLQAQLKAIAPELDRVADYGRLTIIARPLFLVLGWVHTHIGNWGWAIILVTALIKLAFYPLSQASGRSMAKMRAMAPRIKNLQERYKDDKQQLGQQMMELYKREKINPLAGCLPMIVQIPVFLAFYWVLLESVEMRQAPFMLWINDLSSRDPFFVLPLLMGAAMFGQYKLNPAPPDPMQAKVFMFMPLIMTVMFMWFPSGLVLYWLTNTLLSIAQQWNINRVIGVEAAKKN